jgi:hypothetical protein
MKKLLALGLLASSFAFADEGSEVASMMKAPVSDCEVPVVKASYGYYCVGIGPFPAPLIGVGGRYQNGHHGFDGSLQVSTLLFINTAKASANYLYYFYPNLDSQWYIGAGLSWMKVIVLTVREPKPGFVSPQLVVGKQYMNKHGSFRHFQAEIGVNHVYRANFPVSVVISYGISF